MQGIGLVALTLIIIALIHGENTPIVFLTFGLFSILVGSFLRRLPFDDSKLKLRHGMLIAVIAWLWAALIGCLCLVFTTHVSLNGYFENMSAWTGSRLSIYYC